MKTIILIFITLIVFNLSAQQMKDPCSLCIADSTKIVDSSSTDVVVERMNNLRELYDMALMRINRDSLSLLQYSQELLDLKAENAKLTEQILNTDKCLVSVASNFLYIPYENYSIENIALRAYETVVDSTLRSNHLIKYTLLKNYRIDVQSFVDFLRKCQDKFNKPFGVPLVEVQDVIDTLQHMNFYVKYKEYEDWPETYLGKRIQQVETQFEKYDGRLNKIDFKPIIHELETCLKTAEL